MFRSGKEHASNEQLQQNLHSMEWFLRSFSHEHIYSFEFFITPSHSTEKKSSSKKYRAHIHTAKITNEIKKLKYLQRYYAAFTAQKDHIRNGNANARATHHIYNNINQLIFVVAVHPSPPLISLHVSLSVFTSRLMFYTNSCHTLKS